MNPPACHPRTNTTPRLRPTCAQGLLEIGRTTFIILILLAGALVFIADTDRLVLKPLERMVELVGGGWGGAWWELGGGLVVMVGTLQPARPAQSRAWPDPRPR